MRRGYGHIHLMAWATPRLILQVVVFLQHSLLGFFIQRHKPYLPVLTTMDFVAYVIHIKSSTGPQGSLFLDSRINSLVVIPQTVGELLRYMKVQSYKKVRHIKVVYSVDPRELRPSDERKGRQRLGNIRKCGFATRDISIEFTEQYKTPMDRRRGKEKKKDGQK